MIFKNTKDNLHLWQQYITKFLGIIILFIAQIMGRNNSYVNEKRSGEQRRPDMPELREVNQR